MVEVNVTQSPESPKGSWWFLRGFSAERELQGLLSSLVQNITKCISALRIVWVEGDSPLVAFESPDLLLLVVIMTQIFESSCILRVQFHCYNKMFCCLLLAFASFPQIHCLQSIDASLFSWKASDQVEKLNEKTDNYEVESKRGVIRIGFYWLL